MGNNKINYSLLEGLFANDTKQAKQVGQVEQVEQFKQVETTQKRTFKISTEFWDDFLILAKLKGKTQAELINDLIKQSVLANQDKIEKYKEL